MRHVVVEESFEIAFRGAAVVFRGERIDRPVGTRLQARYAERLVNATLESLLVPAPEPHERQVLLLEEANKSELPAGTIIELFNRDELSSPPA